MQGLTNMQKRISFAGGANQQDRMITDKLKTLKKALLYSYQSATVGLYNSETRAYDREFKCLINPNKVNLEIDDKVLSIPYEDIQLNATETSAANVTSTGIKTGSVVYWKDTDTYWLVYYQYLQERAYFRGMMRQCENDTLDIAGVPHHYFLKGPNDQNLIWHKSSHVIFNDLNKNIEIYISKTKEANEFFQRFKKIKIKDKPFKVEAVDRMTSDDILTIYLTEDFTDSWNDVGVEEKMPPANNSISNSIIGEYEVYPFDRKTYTITDISGGSWIIKDSKKAKIISQDMSSVTVEVISGKSGEFELQYIKNDTIVAQQYIKILSL